MLHKVKRGFVTNQFAKNREKKIFLKKYFRRDIITQIDTL